MTNLNEKENRENFFYKFGVGAIAGIIVVSLLNKKENRENFYSKLSGCVIAGIIVVILFVLFVIFYKLPSSANLKTPIVGQDLHVNAREKFLI